MRRFLILQRGVAAHDREPVTVLGKLGMQPLVLAVKSLDFLVELANHFVKVCHCFFEEGDLFFDLHNACVVIHTGILICWGRNVQQNRLVIAAAVGFGFSLRYVILAVSERLWCFSGLDMTFIKSEESMGA